MALLPDTKSFELPNLDYRYSSISDNSTRGSIENLERCSSADSDISEAKTPEGFPTLHILRQCEKQGVFKPKERI